MSERSTSELRPAPFFVRKAEYGNIFPTAYISYHGLFLSVIIVVVCFRALSSLSFNSL